MPWMMFLSLIPILLLGSSAHSAPLCKVVLQTTEIPDSYEGLVYLQSEGKEIFINQQDARAKTNNGGSCGPACVVNVLQGMMATKLKTYKAKPYEVLQELFTNFPTTMNGGVKTPTQVEMLNFAIQKYLPGKEINIDVDTFIPTDDGFSKAKQHKHIPLDLLHLKKDEFKILTFIAVDQQGVKKFGHFAVIRKNNSNGSIEVIDSNFPDVEMYFDLELFAINGDEFSTVRLVPKGASEVYLKTYGDIMLFTTSVITLK